MNPNIDGQVSMFDATPDNHHENRVSRDQMFMEIAKVVAQRSTCDRARVGAVLVDPLNHVISIGYNGSPHGEPHCDEVGHLLHEGHCIRTIHAEENCVSHALIISSPEMIHPFTLYVTHYPCIKCQAMLYETCMSKGIKMLVIYEREYNGHTHFECLRGVNEVLQFSHYEVDKKN
jgi:dCMP deaminase